jgi:hypothetical protein
MACRLRHSALRRVLVASALLVAGVLPGAVVAQDASRGDIKTIVFVCLHGSVNSQMAAAYFNRAANERGLSYMAVSRGVAPSPRIHLGAGSPIFLRGSIT